MLILISQNKKKVVSEERCERSDLNRRNLLKNNKSKDLSILNEINNIFKQREIFKLLTYFIKRFIIILRIGGKFN